MIVLCKIVYFVKQVFLFNNFVDVKNNLSVFGSGNKLREFIWEMLRIKAES